MIHEAQINLITQQLRTGQVINEQILHTYSHIPRSLFVPEKYTQFAYSDLQIPLDHNQIMLTPLEEGLILQNMNFSGTESVLEIGTGTGYLTALLSQLAGKITTVDCFPDFIKMAKKKTQPFIKAEIEFICQYANNGIAKNAPFDAIIITAAIQDLSETIKSQLAPGGKIFYIQGNAPAMKGKLIELNKGSNWQETIVFDTCVPSMLTEKPTSNFVF